MKKSIYFLISILSIGYIASSCQRDDICPEATPTTPRLVIRFVDIQQPDEAKAVNALSVQEATRDTRVQLNEAGETVATIDSISIPLNPSTMSVNYTFTRNTDVTEEQMNDATPEDPDSIGFSYTPDDVYINRACGFKSNYIDLQVDFDFNLGDENWIKNIEIVESNIIDEFVTHVIIFH